MRSFDLYVGHDLALSRMDAAAIRLVVDAWVEQFVELGQNYDSPSRNTRRPWRRTCIRRAEGLSLALVPHPIFPSYCPR